MARPSSSKLAEDIATALDQVLTHVGELYVEAACHVAAVEGACDDAAEAIRYLESEAAAAADAAARSAAAGSAHDGRGAAAAAAGRDGVGSAKPSGGVAATARAPARARPAAAAAGRLQLLHAALGKCTAEHGVGAPALLTDGASPDEEAFVRALSGGYAPRARAPGGEPADEAEPGVRSYGELCAAHASGLELSAALRAATERALSEEEETEPAELRRVAAHCARLLLERGDRLRLDADSAELGRLQARALAHRRACLAALTPRAPAQPSGATSDGAHAGDGWWLPASTAAALGLVTAGPPAHARVHFRSARELEARCRALLEIQASAARLSIERCASARLLPLLARLAGAPAAGRNSLLALFRLAHSVLCTGGRRLAVFLAREEGSGAT